jgi:hypothetical protein
MGATIVSNILSCKSIGKPRLLHFFLKIILGVKKSTANCILYGELGRFPIEVFVKSRMIGMWRTW